MSELAYRALASLQPPAPPTGADTGPLVVGTVLEVDADAAQVRVASRGSTQGSWVAAVAARYKPGGAARVQVDPFKGGRSVQVYPVDEYDPVVLGTLRALNTTTGMATVDVLGFTGAVVPYLQSAYTIGARVWVLLDSWGRPVRVDGHSIEPAATAPAVVQVPEPTGATTQVTVPILPQWSGTWRHIRGAWDRWNDKRREYGGRSTLYQGDEYGSGPLTGLAVYGDQLVNLNATSFDRVQVMLRPAWSPSQGPQGPATVQGSPRAAAPGGAPVTHGATATGEGWVDLPAALREDLRTGRSKSLALVGGNYFAVLGAGNGDGMALAVTATIPK